MARPIGRAIQKPPLGRSTSLRDAISTPQMPGPTHTPPRELIGLTPRHQRSSASISGLKPAFAGRLAKAVGKRPLKHLPKPGAPMAPRRAYARPSDRSDPADQSDLPPRKNPPDRTDPTDPTNHAATSVPPAHRTSERFRPHLRIRKHNPSRRTVKNLSNPPISRFVSLNAPNISDPEACSPPQPIDHPPDKDRQHSIRCSTRFKTAFAAAHDLKPSHTNTPDNLQIEH